MTDAGLQTPPPAPEGEQSLNVVFLLGRIGSMPELGKTGAGAPALGFRLATTEATGEKRGEPARRSTEWHNVVMFGAGAQAVYRLIQRGSRVHVEGKTRTRKWRGDDGKYHVTTEIAANRILALDGPTVQAGLDACSEGSSVQGSAARPA